MLDVEGGSRAAAMKGSMTFVFTHMIMRNFLLLLLLLLAIEIWGFSQRFEHQSWIWASGRGFGPSGWDFDLEELSHKFGLEHRG